MAKQIETPECPILRTKQQEEATKPDIHRREQACLREGVYHAQTSVGQPLRSKSKRELRSRQGKRRKDKSFECSANLSAILHPGKTVSVVLLCSPKVTRAMSTSLSCRLKHSTADKWKVFGNTNAMSGFVLHSWLSVFMTTPERSDTVIRVTPRTFSQQLRG